MGEVGRLAIVVAVLCPLGLIVHILVPHSHSDKSSNPIIIQLIVQKFRSLKFR